MSQAKVEHNKELKRNRKKLVKKQRRSETMAKAVGVLAVCAVVGWIGYSVYGLYEQAHANDPLPTVAADVSAIEDYVDGLTEDDAE